MSESRYDEVRALAQKLLADVRACVERNEQLLRDRAAASSAESLASRLRPWRARWL